jgi:vacuolar-type H+-ATPase subunit H
MSQIGMTEEDILNKLKEYSSSAYKELEELKSNKLVAVQEAKDEYEYLNNLGKV